MKYRTALITGASSGIGRSLARRLARDGVEVVVCARRTDRLEEVAQEMTRSGGRARVLTLDVSDTTRTVEAIRAIDDELGGLDLVVANAGKGRVFPPEKTVWEDIAPVLALNFQGAIATLTAVLPRMVARDRGHLVAVSSLAAYAAMPHGAAYCSGKAGLSMFMSSLRIDLGGTGVGVTTVHPGFVKTEMTANNSNEMPLAFEADEAADHIVDRLPRNPAVIDFPLPMAGFARFVGAMPRPVASSIMKKFPVPDDNP
jgi:short-subunit dehydrogenase